MRLNSNLILRQVGGEYMIVNPFSETMDMAQVYSLNETAAWLWKQLENKEFTDRKSTRLNSSHITRSRMPSSA